MEIQTIAENLVQKAGFLKTINLSPIECGGNNKVYRINGGDGSFILKSYFYHEADQRNRLKSEYAFISFCRDQSIRVVPKPFAYDSQNRIALYEFIQGDKLRPGEINDHHIFQSLDFYFKLNSFKKIEKAQKLPDASEACFSVNDHIACVDRRLERLKLIKGPDANAIEAIEFIDEKLLPTWNNIKDRVLKRVATYGIDPEKVIRPADRCLSPSDFGFHNAIKEDNNKLRFIDFEYAGWDDTAKMVCDFFCQPEVPVPLSYFDMFVEAVVHAFPEPEKLSRRIKILLPVYKIKWICIMLNVFHPIDSMRRKFAFTSIDEDKQKIIQLEKARNAVKHL